MSRQYLLISAAPGQNGLGSFVVAGDLTSVFTVTIPPSTFEVKASGALDGLYEVAASTFDGTHTTITVTQQLASAALDAGAYITNTSTYNLSVAGSPVAIQQNTVDTTSTSLSLIGKFIANYGEDFLQDFVNLLTHFSGPTAPANPRIGQTWFNTTTELLMVYLGSSWIPANSNAVFDSAVVMQSTPQISWTCAHNLNTNDLVFTVYNNTGGDTYVPIIPGDFQFVDNNTVTIGFSSPISGKVVFKKA